MSRVRKEGGSGEGERVLRDEGVGETGEGGMAVAESQWKRSSGSGITGSSP